MERCKHSYDLLRILVILVACGLITTGHANAQPDMVERTWSPSYSVKAKSVVGNQNGWWISAEVQIAKDHRYQPVVLHWQPWADSFAVHRLLDTLQVESISYVSGHVSSLQRTPDGQIIASANYDNECDVNVHKKLYTKEFLSTDSSSFQWTLNNIIRLNERYTFPSDTSIVIADSIYGISPNGQSFSIEGIPYNSSFWRKQVNHFALGDEKAGFVTGEGLSIYNQNADELHRDTTIEPLDATNWQGDTIAATVNDSLFLLNNSLKSFTLKTLSNEFARISLLIEWQDKLLLAGPNAQETQWKVMQMDPWQQLSTLMEIGDTSWVLEDMSVYDSTLVLAGVQHKRGAEALLLKTVQLPSNTKNRQMDIALKNVSTQNISFEPTPNYQGLYDVTFDVAITVKNKSNQDTVNNLGGYLGFDMSSICESHCNENHFHQSYESISILPGDSATFTLNEINNLCVNNPYTQTFCPVVLTPNGAIDSNINNNTMCKTVEVVGISEKDKLTGELRIYPTYVRDRLYIENTSSKEATVTIHNTTGRLVTQKTFKRQQVAISLSSQPSGVYIATLHTSDGTLSQKFVVGE